MNSVPPLSPGSSGSPKPSAAKQAGTPREPGPFRPAAVYKPVPPKSSGKASLLIVLLLVALGGTALYTYRDRIEAALVAGTHAPASDKTTEASVPAEKPGVVAARLTLVAKPADQKHLGAFMPSARDFLRLTAAEGNFERVEINGADATSACVKTGLDLDCRPAAGWKPGLNTVKVSLITTGVTSEYVLYVSHHPGPIAKVVWNNTSGTAAIDGVPFLPMGIYNVYEKDMPKIAGYGFNLIQAYGHSSNRPVVLENERLWFDTAQKNGLKVMWATNRKDASEQNLGKIAGDVTAMMNHPALFCHYLSDEPDLLGLSPESMEKVNLLVKALDPFHPTVMSTWKQGKYAACADIDMRQCYAGRPAFIAKDFGSYLQGSLKRNLSSVTIINTMDEPFGKTMGQAEPAEKFGNSPGRLKHGLKPGDPGWKEANDAAKARAKLVAANLENPPMPFHSAFPAGGIFRSGAYTAIAKGSPGVWWWLYQEKFNPNGNYTIFQHPETLKVMIATLAELRSLTPVLGAPATTSETWEKDGILFRTRRTPKGDLVIAVNLTREPVSGEYLLEKWEDSATGELRVLNEDRQVTLQGATLKDTWKPEETHVYLRDAR